MSQTTLSNPSAPLDIIVEAVVADAGGDLRLALRDLVRRQHAAAEVMPTGHARRVEDIGKSVSS